MISEEKLFLKRTYITKAVSCKIQLISIITITNLLTKIFSQENASWNYTKRI